MKKFLFAFGLIFSAFSAPNSYAQLGLNDLMETDDAMEVQSQEAPDIAADAVNNAGEESSATEAEDLEKSLDNLFADDLASVIGKDNTAEKVEEKVEETADDDNVTTEDTIIPDQEEAEDTPSEVANEEPKLETDETEPDAEAEADEEEAKPDVEAEDDENEADSETDEKAENEASADETDETEKAASPAAEDEEYNIFADDEVDDLFDESTGSAEGEATEAQDAEDVLPIGSEAANSAPKEDFMDDYFEDLEQQKQRDETAYKAQKDALRLISDEPQVVTLKDEQRLSLREVNQKRKEMEQQLKSAKAKQPPLAKPEAYVVDKTDTSENTAENADTTALAENQATETPAIQDSNFSAEAPFGLRWNAGKDEIEAMGFTTAPAEMDNYEGVYVVRNPQQPQKIFTLVTAVFGAHDHLQAIYAQSMPTEDTPRADKVLKLYHQYYDALEKKYGNAQEHFVPNTKPAPEAKKAVSKDEDKDKNEVEGEEKAEDTENGGQTAEEKPATKTDNGIGNDNFLKELKEEDTALFATFGGDNVKVTLTVLADEKGKSYITLDYENTYVIKQDQSADFDALLNDL